MQSTLNEPESEAWRQIAPLLDDAISRLGEKDRNAVLLRFFESKNLSEVGAALGASEDAAKMRVNRALEKLHRFFNEHGISSTTAILAGEISAHSVQAAPAMLAKSVTAVAIAKGAAASASTLTLIKGALKVMAWTKVKTAILVGAAVILAATTGTMAMKAFKYHQPARKLEMRTEVHMKAYFIEVPESDAQAVLNAGTVLTTTNQNSVEILDDDKMLQLLRLFGSNGATSLAEPEVITMPGRQTSMRVGDVNVDLISTLFDDGFTLKMKIIASATETLTAEANIWDSQTIALGSPKTGGQSRLFVLVTTRLLDPAGNPIRSTAGLPFKPGTIPPQ
jgi:hypothetical protein